MRKTLIALLLVGLLGGCNWNKHSKHTAQSYQRWHAARAKVMADLANRHYEAGDFTKAEESATEALTMDSANVPAMVLLAKVLIENGKPAKAIDQLRVAEAIQKNNPEVAFLLGVAIEKRGDHAEALRHYQKARSLDAANDGYLRASAEVLVAMGQPARALELVHAWLDNRDATPEMNGLAGELAMMLGLYKQAVGYYRDCLTGDAVNAVAREGLARAYFFAGRYADAVDTLQVLVAEKEYADKAWVHVMLADCQMAMNQPRAARKTLTRAVELSPRSPRIWNALAKATLAVGDMQGAITAANQAISLGGEGLEATLVVAYGLMRQGKALEAIRMLDTAAQQHPDDATVLCVLGRCYQRLGRPTQAAGLFRRALKVDPANPLAQSLVAISQGSDGR